MGQRVVWTTETSHGINAVIGGNAGRPIHLPADTQTRRHLLLCLFVFLIYLSCKCQGIVKNLIF